MSLIKVERDEHIAIVKLNRPEKLNALSFEMRAELGATFAKIATDESIKAVVMTGEGRAFCAGADLGASHLPPHPMGALASFETTSERQLGMWNLPQPVVAAVNGYALGRGLEVALWCDIVLASEEAQFGEPECRDGFFVASIIPALVSPQQAKLLMISGDRIPAKRACEIGLVTEVVPGKDCIPAAIALAKRLGSIPSPTARLIKRYCNAVADGIGIVEAQHYGNTIGTLLRTHTDEQMGITELVNIRKNQGMKAYFQARDKPFDQDDAWTKLSKKKS